MPQAIRIHHDAEGRYSMLEYLQLNKMKFKDYNEYIGEQMRVAREIAHSLHCAYRLKDKIIINDKQVYSLESLGYKLTY